MFAFLAPLLAKLGAAGAGAAGTAGAAGAAGAGAAGAGAASALPAFLGQAAKTGGSMILKSGAQHMLNPPVGAPIRLRQSNIPRPQFSQMSSSPGTMSPSLANVMMQSYRGQQPRRFY